jgi:hypothetical protein
VGLAEARIDVPLQRTLRALLLGECHERNHGPTEKRAGNRFHDDLDIRTEYVESVPASCEASLDSHQVLARYECTRFSARRRARCGFSD